MNSPANRSMTATRVSDTVEEVGIAERHVPGARGHLCPHVGHDDVDRDDAKSAVVDRNDRTVPAAMFAAAAGLGVADRPSFGAPLEGRVLRQRRQALTIRHEELDARDARGWRPRRGPPAPDAAPTTLATSDSSNSPPMITDTPCSRSRAALSGA